MCWCQQSQFCRTLVHVLVGAKICVVAYVADRRRQLYIFCYSAANAFAKMLSFSTAVVEHALSVDQFRVKTIWRPGWQVARGSADAGNYRSARMRQRKWNVIKNTEQLLTVIAIDKRDFGWKQVFHNYSCWFLGGWSAPGACVRLLLYGYMVG